MRGLAEASGGEDDGDSKAAGRGALTRQQNLKNHESSRVVRCFVALVRLFAKAAVMISW